MKASNASAGPPLLSSIHISCNARLAFGCWLFGNLAITFAVLCTQQRCSRVFGPHDMPPSRFPPSPTSAIALGGAALRSQEVQRGRPGGRQVRDVLNEE